MARIVGTNGNDSLVGTSSADTIEGLAGNDTLVGLAGNDSLVGGAGNDRYVVTSGDVLNDSGGIDTVESSTTWSLGAAFENLVLTGTNVTSGSGNELANVINGSAGNNWLRGRGGNDTLFGNGGNDTFNMSLGAGGFYGNDSIDGGTGTDTLDFGAAALSAVVIDLGAGTASGGGAGGAGTVALSSVENANGSAFDDVIIGSAAANFLFGYNGNDTLDGREGNDRLEGGAGADQYVFAASPGAANADTVVGFASGADQIVLDGDAFANLGANGNFAPGDARFAAGAGFNSGRDANDRVVYNTTTGQLWYDADGNGSGAAQLIATLQGAPALAATDLVARNSATGQVGTEGDDSIVGTAGNDSIDGRGGDDTIDGLGGDDAIEGGDGNDLVLGGSGNDAIRGGFGANTLVGGSGDDFLDTSGVGFSDSLERDSLVGGDGNDTLDGGGGADTMEGGLGDDTYYVYTFLPGEQDLLPADPGGVDSVITIDADWTLGAGFENLSTVPSDQGGSAAMHLAGNELNNVIDGTETDFANLFGMGGDDTIHGSHLGGSTWLSGGDGNDELNGYFGNDTFIGGHGNDLMLGRDGNDQFYVFQEGTGPNYGSDGVHGGNGHDALYFFDDGNAQSGIEVDLRTGWIFGGGAGGSGAINVSSIEFIEGTTLSDSFIGDDGAQTFDAGWGADTLNGGAGNDRLLGGNDDGGTDTFIFQHYGAANADDVEFFFTGQDKVALDATVFTALGSGDFTAGDARFFAGAGANSGQDATDRVVYNTTTGQLWYDADGSGTGAAQLFAVLPGGGAGALAATDIQVIGSGSQGQAINGTAGDDSLTGTAGNDTINGFGGNDDLAGAGGDDSIVGGMGDDSLLGQDGADHLIGGDGNDSLDGADDFSFSNDFADTLDGGSGNDVYYVSGAETVIDSGGLDTVATKVDWTLGAGIENVWIEWSNQTITGNELSNHFTNFINWTDDQTLPAPSTVFAGAGNDTYGGGWAGNSILFHGEAGDDVMHASGYVRFHGGAGADTFIPGFPGPLADPEDAPFERNFEILDFTSGVDKIRLDAEHNMSQLGVSGNFAAGDARFHAAPGATSGHDADDRVIYDTSTGDLWYDADGSGAHASAYIGRLTFAPTLVATDFVVDNGAAPGGQTINGTSAPDTLTGGAGNDTISGGAGSDRLFGGDGNDSLLGGTEADNMYGDNGDDWLDGDAGQDRLNGGAGADSFVFNDPLASANADYVNDFVSGSDRLLLDDAVFGNLGGPGSFTAGDERFVAAPGARYGVEADDRLMYDTSSGKLYYDPDGSGGASAYIVAVVQGAPTLVSTDITVI